jgi:hypothetical protein
MDTKPKCEEMEKLKPLFPYCSCDCCDYQIPENVGSVKKYILYLKWVFFDSCFECPCCVGCLRSGCHAQESIIKEARERKENKRYNLMYRYKKSVLYKCVSVLQALITLIIFVFAFIVASGIIVLVLERTNAVKQFMDSFKTVNYI